MPSGQSPRQNEHSANISQKPAKNRNFSRCTEHQSQPQIPRDRPQPQKDRNRINANLSEQNSRKKKQILKNIKTK